MQNLCEISFLAISENEAFARMVASAFVMPLNPTMEELADIKTAISEAITNAIIHGYNLDGKSMIHMRCEQEGDCLIFQISDEGQGMEDVALAMQPLYTSKPELERSGMGFSFMEAFMDFLDVKSEVGKGTIVTMKKRIRPFLSLEKEEM